MTMYQTELDGMKHIKASKEVKENDYVFIQDDIYKDDITLFKNKKTLDNRLDLKIVKLAEIKPVDEEEQTGYKFNQLYTSEDIVFTTQNRLNKNQLLQLGGKFYIVSDITKHKDQPQALDLSEVSFVAATNMYAVYKRKATDNERKIYKMCSSWSEAFGLVRELREKREDSSFYCL